MSSIPSTSGIELLVRATLEGTEEHLVLALGRQPDVNKLSQQDCTPLHLAVRVQGVRLRTC